MVRKFLKKFPFSPIPVNSITIPIPATGPIVPIPTGWEFPSFAFVILNPF